MGSARYALDKETVVDGKRQISGERIPGKIGFRGHKGASAAKAATGEIDVAGMSWHAELAC